MLTSFCFFLKFTLLKSILTITLSQLTYCLYCRSQLENRTDQTRIEQYITEIWLKGRLVLKKRVFCIDGFDIVCQKIRREQSRNKHLTLSYTGFFRLVRHGGFFL